MNIGISFADSGSSLVGVVCVVLFQVLLPDKLAEGVVRLVFRAAQAQVRQFSVNIRDRRERRTGIEEQHYPTSPPLSVYVVKGNLPCSSHST
jgi:hypothetical protein